MAVLDVQLGKPNRGQAVYMATCPACGFRKRLNYAAGERDGVRAWFWQFWCKCKYTEIIGTTAELLALIRSQQSNSPISARCGDS